LSTKKGCFLDEATSDKIYLYLGCLKNRKSINQRTMHEPILRLSDLSKNDYASVALILTVLAPEFIVDREFLTHSIKDLSIYGITAIIL
jgi:hypothetical protein